MEIRIMDGKKELIFQVSARRQDGTLIDFDNPEHVHQLNDTYIKGMQSLGYYYEPGIINNQGAV